MQRLSFFTFHLSFFLIYLAVLLEVIVYSLKFLLIDYTPEEARKAAKWLIAQADACDTPGGSTIRKYSSRTDYEEIPGFTIFGSQWSIDPHSEEEWVDGRGTIAPRV